MPVVPLLDRLAARFPAAKRTTLREMIASGRVRVNGRAARSAKQPVDDADALDVADVGRAPRQPDRATPGPLRVVFEDADLLVVHKPAGLLTSTVPNETRPTLLAHVRAYVGASRPAQPRRADDPDDARVGLIHRLDRDASGLLVFSKSHAAYASLKDQFFRHTVDRAYAAVVPRPPDPPAGEVETWLEERADGTVYVSRNGFGQRALTRYETADAGPGGALLRVTLFTGRKHQIRVHLSHRGWPIVGDPVYGPPHPRGPMLLCATDLALDHPRTGERVRWTIPVPAIFRQQVATVTRR